MHGPSITRGYYMHGPSVSRGFKIHGLCINRGSFRFRGGVAEVSGHLGTRYSVLEISVLNNKNNLIEFKSF